MGFSEYENIEIFNKTQSFDINKYENQILRLPDRISGKVLKLLNSSFLSDIIMFKEDK
jgi:hypothetical protein